MSEELCTHCGTFEHLHADGACPRIVLGLVDPPNQTLPFTTPVKPKHAGGRPPGRKNNVYRPEDPRLTVAQQRAITHLIADKASHAIDDVCAYRIPKRPNVPKRSVSEAKDAALALINQQLWNLEGKADEEGLSSDEEGRVLKLLAGLNAALPKSAEGAPTKPLSEMTDEEIAALERKK